MQLADGRDGIDLKLTMAPADTNHVPRWQMRIWRTPQPYLRQNGPRQTCQIAKLGAPQAKKRPETAARGSRPGFGLHDVDETDV